MKVSSEPATGKGNRRRLYGMNPDAWRGIGLHPIFVDMKGLRVGSEKSTAVVEARIAAVLKDLAPLLRIDHCSLQMSSFDALTGQLTIRIAGSCPDCEGSPAMFATAIEAHVKQRVVQVATVRVTS
jgi:Fe-S cluster biogenesis protein NfuA